MDAKKLKLIVRGDKKPTFGTDPNEPWSVRAGITESEAGMLHAYLRSRGINPKFVGKDTKISHSKSSEFQKWKRDHMFDDPADYVSSVTREKMKAQRAQNEEVSEAWENSQTKKIKSLIKGKGPEMTSLEKFRAAAAERAKKHAEIDKEMRARHAAGKEDMKGAIDRLEKQLNKEESGVSKEKETKFHTSLDKLVHKTFGPSPSEKKEKQKMKKEEVEQIDEISKSTLDSYRDKSSASLKNAKINRDAAEPGKNMSKGFADLHAKSDAIAKKRVKGLMGYLQRKQGVKPMGEDVFQDTYAATQTPFDMGTQADDREPTYSKKKEMSKSARMIKALYKKHKMVKEELYDHEKEDKSVATYGKKPKVEKQEVYGDEDNQAAMVLKGGTTLTGQTRDTLEIDPVMRKANKNNNNQTDK